MTVRILEGDCRDVLRTLPDESVHCCVTSPPYFGLRDYGVGGQMGLEASPEEFIEGMVAVFREVRRVLRHDGTLWLNIGDSYAGSGRGGNDRGVSGLEGSTDTQLESRAAKRKMRTDVSDAQRKNATAPRGSRLPSGYHSYVVPAGRAWTPPPANLKNKDMIGIPWMLAFALRADGWYLRQDIIWSKPNPMPESIKDRCTKSHEYLFLLSKSQRYYYDAAAIAEPASQNTHARIAQDVANQLGSARGNGGEKKNGNMKAVVRSNGVGWGYADGEAAKPRTVKPVSGWDMGPGSHRKMAGRYTGAGPKSKANADGSRQNESFNTAISSEVVLERNKRSVWSIPTAPFKEAHFATFPPALVEPCIRAGCPVGGVVLDCFGGAGTTGLVADRLQRDAILIELNPEYSAIARRRIAGDSPLFAEVAHA